MRRVFKGIIAVLIIGFSVFLVQRSCHEDGPKLDPNEKGGFAYARPTSTPSEERLLYLREDAYEFDSRRMNAPPSETPASDTATMNRVRGDWVLTGQDSTKLELRIEGKIGFLKAYFYEAGSGKRIAVDLIVNVIAIADLVLVTTSDVKLSGGDMGNKNKGEPNRYMRISLFFDFRGNETGKVIWRLESSSEWLPLKVVSHTK